jgi:predicted nucleic acid-binding Zn ribbon protein
MRLANSLPQAVRRGSRKGIHGLIVRSSWEREDEEGAIGSMYDLEHYLREWPLGLQAFVLHDPEGEYRNTDLGLVTHFDLYHHRPLENIHLLGRSQQELEEVISKARGRINLEIELAEQVAFSRRQQNPPITKRQTQVVTPLNYEVGDRKFTGVGLRHLLVRARQRFFFVLAAEEILYSLTAPDPTEELRRAWYIGESGALRSQLYVHDDKVHLGPPVLFSFVVGIRVSRIRRCRVCGNYFWAGRKDKTVCSEKCGATNRKRQERQRYLEIKIGDRIPQKKTKSPIARKRTGHHQDRMAKKGN